MEVVARGGGGGLEEERGRRKRGFSQNKFSFLP